MSKQEVKISIIAAVAANGVIGNKGEIPWYLPSDFAFFKSATIDKPIIMGRKTFESIGKPLPKRTNIVISRQKDFQPDGVIVVDNLDAAVKRATLTAKADKKNEIMIIGGANIYQQAMKFADRLYISHVELTPDGDSMFPSITKSEWRIVKEIATKKSPCDSAEYKVMQYEKIS